MQTEKLSLKSNHKEPPVKNIKALIWNRMTGKSVKPLSCKIETLEPRQLMSAAPRVSTILCDNRGQATLTFSAPLNAATVTSSTARILTAGADSLLNTADDVAATTSIQYTGNTMFLTANLPAGTRYRVQLLSGGIFGTNGKALYGNTAKGGRGGNYDTSTINQSFFAHFNTIAGQINVILTANTPITNANFNAYTNLGAWDNTFIQTNPVTANGAKAHFTLVGGTFHVNSSNQIELTTVKTKIKNEFANHNTLGTIAMQKLNSSQDSDPANSATNTWFFNLNDNRKTLDSQNGGYTVFGQITDKQGRNTLAALDRFSVFNATNFIDSSNATSGALTDTKHQLTTAIAQLPVINPATVTTNNTIHPESDLVTIYRVSMLMDTKPTIIAGTQQVPA